MPWERPVKRPLFKRRLGGGPHLFPARFAELRIFTVVHVLTAVQCRSFVRWCFALAWACCWPAPEGKTCVSMMTK